MVVPALKWSFRDVRYSIQLHGIEVVVSAYAPVVWVSVTKLDVNELPPNARKFPALVDTGNTARFLIRQDHFNTWTGLRSDDLTLDPRKATVTDASGRKRTPARRQGKVWLHPDPKGPALDLNADGILIHESPIPGQVSKEGPPLPLLGASCLFPLGLVVHVDYKQLTFTIGNELRLC